MFAPPPPLQLIRFLGAGAVFQAGLVRLADGRVAVCKRLRSELATSTAAQHAVQRERFALELLAGVSAPLLLGQGSDDRGPWWLQTVAPGQTVAQSIASPTAMPAFSQQQARDCLRGAFAALAAVHVQGVVHGDIHPGHIVLASDGGVTFIDFGLARAASMPTAWLRTGERGTLPYVCPEVAAQREVWNDAADRYALAASMWTLLARATPPLPGHPAARLQRQVEEGFPWQQLPLAPELEALAVQLRPMLAVDPRARSKSLEGPS